ncbi:Arabinose operon regulatory protein [Dyadobacter sp. CECT 9275]|uniref:Arabinose operon regulatory protein n=1 Tax=Dyadobacter helix TaxID=2822344 RepID=A0A916JH13_9BACT|nr:helix-turn-helix domain-containing protein [Dyadobacter sp. CECT 9275]CAG5006672.1 Arabinose operon regulatory protein [Dyadobacter sp. CECT 9275]
MTNNPVILAAGQYSGRIDQTIALDGLITTISNYAVGYCFREFHYHEHAVISFVLEGGNMESRKNGSFERKPGDIAFFAPGEWHRTISGAPSCRNINLEIPEHFFKAYRLTTLHVAHYKSNMLRIVSDIRRGSPTAGTSIMMSVLDLLSGAEDTYSGKKPLWAKRLEELLQDEWNKNLTLRELSAALQVHPVTISKNFASYFGMSFGEYLRKMRIERSLALLKDTDMPLVTVAFQCGFADQSHFIRNFKQFTGFLPSHFRRL